MFSNVSRDLSIILFLLLLTQRIFLCAAPARAPNQGGKIRVINQLNGARALLSAHADAVIDVVSSPSDEALFASVGSDGVVLLWRIVEPDAASDDTSELTYALAASASVVCLSDSAVAFSNYVPSRALVGHTPTCAGTRR